MSVLDVILSRRSIRRYEKKPVPEEVLNNILEAGRHAPSAGNTQPWRFIVLTDDEIKEKLSQGRWNRFIRDSAFTIVGCGYMGNPYVRKWSTIEGIMVYYSNMKIVTTWQIF